MRSTSSRARSPMPASRKLLDRMPGTRPAFLRAALRPGGFEEGTTSELRSETMNTDAKTSSARVAFENLAIIRAYDRGLMVFLDVLFSVWDVLRAASKRLAPALGFTVVCLLGLKLAGY